MPQQPLTPNILPLAVAPDEAANLIGSTESSLEKDRAVGHLGIPYVKAGRRVLYLLTDLKYWLNAHRVNPGNLKQGECHAHYEQGLK
jgi:hypothetical protein